jgi:hypothetical protein
MDFQVHGVWVRTHRHIPTAKGFERKELPLSQERVTAILAGRARALQRINRLRQAQGRTPGLNLAAALDHASKVLPGKSAEKLLALLERPQRTGRELEARRRFVHSLINYADEKTYPGRLSPLDEELKKHVGKTGFSFADVGCSHGVTTEDTKRAFPHARVVGFDAVFPPEHSLEGKRAEYREHDILRKPLPEKFDVIRFANVNPHLTQEGQKRAREHLVESLKEGSILIIDEARHFHHFYQKINGELKYLGGVGDKDYRPDYDE